MEGVAAVDRALAVAVALADCTEPQTLAAIAKATGLYKSTLLRLLASLARYGMVVRRNDQRYALGPLAFRLGRAYESTFHLGSSLLPLMNALVQAGSESASFHVRHDDSTRLCILRVDSMHSTLDRIRVGDILPLDRGAPGRVLTKFEGGVSGSPRVITSFGERDGSCAAVACPVFGPDGELLGALSLSGPISRFTDTAVRRLAAMVFDAAREATVALGGHFPTPAARSALEGIGRKKSTVPATKTRRNSTS